MSIVKEHEEYFLIFQVGRQQGSSDRTQHKDQWENYQHNPPDSSYSLYQLNTEVFWQINGGEK